MDKFPVDGYGLASFVSYMTYQKTGTPISSQQPLLIFKRSVTNKKFSDNGFFSFKSGENDEFNHIQSMK
jgi:hypothetical protein